MPRLAAAWIVPACSTRRVLEMPPLGCWLACPVIWKLVLAYHNSAYKHAIVCVAGCSSRGFRTRNRVTCIGIQGARNAPKNGSPEIFILLLQPHSIVWAPGARLQACSLPRRQSAEPARIIILLIRPHLLVKGEHYFPIHHPAERKNQNDEGAKV